MDSETTFFSYSREDSDFVLKLAKDLRQMGVSIWLDQLDIKGGSRWDLSIEKALKNSSRMLVILTPDSVQSHNVMDEVSFALEEGKKVIPIFHKPCDIPFRLRRLHYVNFIENYDTALVDLLEALDLKKINSSTEEKENDKSEAELEKPKIKDKRVDENIEKRSGESRKLENAQNSEKQQKKIGSNDTLNKGNSGKEKDLLGGKSKHILPVLTGAVIILFAFVMWKILSADGTDDSSTTKSEETSKAASDSLEIHAWKNAIAGNTVENFKEYQQNYPNGQHFDLAKKKIDSIEKKGEQILSSTNNAKKKTTSIKETKKESDEDDKIDEDNTINEDERIPFAVIEDIPIFPGCENAADKKECFSRMMHEHIRTNLQYPKIAQEMGAQGRVMVQFTIQKDGGIGDIKVRGPEKNLEAEALRLINILPKMTPGRQRGRAVSVLFSIPITFKL